MPYRNKAKMSLRVISVICFNLQHLPYRSGADRSEDLVKVRQHGITCHATITEHGIIRLLVCYSLYNLVGNVVIEASIQEALGYVEHLATGNCGFLNLRRKQNTKVKHNLEQQIFGCSVLFDVVSIVIENGLFNLIGTVEHFLHGGFGDAEKNLEKKKKTC